LGILWYCVANTERRTEHKCIVQQKKTRMHFFLCFQDSGRRKWNRVVDRGFILISVSGFFATPPPGRQFLESYDTLPILALGSPVVRCSTSHGAELHPQYLPSPAKKKSLVYVITVTDSCKMVKFILQKW
jgi:hypothetical protein